MNKLILLATLSILSTPALAETFTTSSAKQCGTEWKADKARSDVIAKAGWPTYFSACVARHKELGDTFTTTSRKNESGLDKAELQKLITSLR